MLISRANLRVYRRLFDSYIAMDDKLKTILDANIAELNRNTDLTRLAVQPWGSALAAKSIADLQLSGITGASRLGEVLWASSVNPSIQFEIGEANRLAALPLASFPATEVTAAAKSMANLQLSELTGVPRLVEDLRTSSVNPSIRLELGEVNPLAALSLARVPMPEIATASKLTADPRLHSINLLGEMQRASALLAESAAYLHLPEVTATCPLLDEFRSWSITTTLQRYGQDALNVQRAMEAMNSPWLNSNDLMRSINGFSAIQAMGHALNEMIPFGERLTEALRTDCGDWREKITWPKPIFTDVAARAEFYIDRGFDPALTDFPTPAFDECLDIAGFRRAPLTLVALYGPPIEYSTDEEEEEGLERTNTAHDWLQRLESCLRRYLDRVMTAGYGANWAKHRLPNGMYDEWQERKRDAEQATGRAWPLICYADFTDYQRIICKRDNWRELFAPVFYHPDAVRETFQRLYPIRICTMHARPITKEDELFLFVEVRRITRAIS